MQTKRRCNRTRKTRGGGFTTFITSDNNHEYKKVGKKWMKTMKGLDVKLKKDKNGNPIEWFIRPNDTNMLAKLFNTRKKGILMSHAIFCKKFMNEDSLLGKRYPKLISKANDKNIKCHDHGPDRGPDRGVTLKRTSPTLKPMSKLNPVVIEPKYDYPNPMPDTMTDASNFTDLPVIRPPVIPANMPVIRPPVIPANRPPVIPANMPAIPANIPVIRPPVIPPLNPNRSFIPNPESNLSYLAPTRGMTNLNMFGPTSYLLQPQLQQGFQRFKTHNYSQADLDTMIAMGFDQNQAIHALQKYNNLHKAIDACIRNENTQNPITKQDRQGNAFATFIKLYKKPEIRNFVVVDNGGYGDCLFLSLAETLMRANRMPPNADLHGSAFILRQKIVDYVMKNLNHYFINSTQQTFQDAIHMGVDVNGQTLYMNNYEYEMRKQHTYGTEIEISAAAQLYKIHIYVVNTNGIGWDQLYIGDSTNATWSNTWYIFNMNNGHYTSLHCTDGPGNCPN